MPHRALRYLGSVCHPLFDVYAPSYEYGKSYFGFLLLELAIIVLQLVKAPGAYRSGIFVDK